MREQLTARLREVGVTAADLTAGRRTSWDVWLALEGRWGRRVTLVDLYELEAVRRGVRVEELPAVDRQAMAERTFAVQFPGWRPVPTSAARGEPVEIAAYDDGWPQQYERWRRLLSDQLGDEAVRIEHVGSTAVPGLAAKPVIDIQVSVSYLENEAGYVRAVEAVGVELQSREHARRYFRPPRGRPRTVQVHVCSGGGEWEREHLLFRDYLRARDDVRDAYAKLKREIAQRWRSDRLAYTAEKTAFILDALDAADEWCGRGVESAPRGDGR